MKRRTLDEAKKDFYNEVEKGTICECCGRYSKVYRRKLNNDMASFLIRLARTSQYRPYEYFHVRDITPNVGEKASTEGSYLVHWGLVEKDGVGIYAITPKGLKFVEGKLKVRRDVVIFNGEQWRFDGDFININDALGEKFFYNELMND